MSIRVTRLGSPNCALGRLSVRASERSDDGRRSVVAVDLTAPPFRLDAAGVAWVEATLAGMHA